MENTIHGPLLHPHAKRNGIVTVVYIIALTGYVLVKDIGVPLIDSVTGKGASTNSARLAVIDNRINDLDQWHKDIDQKVTVLLEGQARREEAIANLTKVCDRIESKIDAHIAKGK